MTDDRERYGRLFHEQGRLTVNAEREKPFAVEPWDKRTAEQREIDMRGASAVAVRAVADAKLRNERLEAQVFALGAHMPTIIEALRGAGEYAAAADLPAAAKRCRDALEALGAGEPQERTDEKGADHG